MKVIIDFSNAVYRSYYGTERDKMENSDGVNVGFILGIVKILQHAISQTKSLGGLPELIIAEDRAPTRKRNLYTKFQSALSEYSPDKNWDGSDPKARIRYKGNRDKEEIGYDPIAICKDFIKCIPSTTIYCEGEEADDVIASYVANNHEKRMFLYSTDKDMWQLIPKYSNLKIILGDGNSPSDELMLKHFETTDWNKIMLHKVLRGDSGDNIKSILRFPFKKNLDVYQDCAPNPEGFLRLLIERRGADSDAVKHFMKYLKVAILNYKVVKLRTDLYLETETVIQPDRERWNRLCRVYETPSILNSPLLKIY
jgi:5'-3' exonuclease